MDPRSGEVFGPMDTGDAELGEELKAERLEAMARKLADADERVAETERAAAHIRGGGKVVAVEAAVVQRLRLGDRELHRRRRRR